MSRAKLAGSIALGLAVIISVDGAIPLLKGYHPKLSNLPFMIAFIFASLAAPLWCRQSWASIICLTFGVLGVVSGIIWVIEVVVDSNMQFWSESYPGARFVEIVEWLGMSSLVAVLYRPLAFDSGLERTRGR
jgi:hypothetical protein